MKETGEQFDDRIIEATWDKSAKNWIFHRFRDDKDAANHSSTIDKIIISIRDGVEQKEVCVSSVDVGDG